MRPASTCCPSALRQCWSRTRSPSTPSARDGCIARCAGASTWSCCCEQLTWLKDKLKSSDATWVVIASSVPLAIPTGWPPEGGRDGWANFDQPSGFEQELREIFRYAAEIGRKDLIFISADVHFAAAFSYRPYAGQPSFVVHELVTGPLSAGIGAIDDYDRDLGAERLFMHAPPTADAVHVYADARRYFGFGELDIDAAGTLSATLRDVDGKALYELRLTPEAAMRLARWQ